MQIDQATITFLLGLAALISIIFNVYNTFRNPQIKTDQETSSLKQDMASLKNEMRDIKETDIRLLRVEIKSLTDSNNELSKTVVRLATIIDERIPKGSPNLTPPGA